MVRRIKELFGNRIFSGLFLLFWIHQFMQKILMLEFPFLDSFLDPFLSIPVVLYVFQWERKHWWNIHQDLSVLDTILITALLTLLFEWGFPSLSNALVTDVWDIPFYFLGTLFYCLFLRD